MENWYQCAWCHGWIKTEDPRLESTYQEAFDARGCSYECPLEGCKRRFWTSYALGPGETMKKYHKGGYHAFMDGKRNWNRILWLWYWKGSKIKSVI